jgi:hypothetical protein
MASLSGPESSHGCHLLLTGSTLPFSQGIILCIDLEKIRVSRASVHHGGAQRDLDKDHEDLGSTPGCTHHATDRSNLISPSVSLHGKWGQ